MATMTMTQSSISPRQHKLRTYVVLTAKSSRPRLPSFTDVLDDSSSSMPKLPDECIAYESYAAVASRFQASSRAATSPTRDLRWSDIARPRLYVASYLPNSAAVTKPRSQKARKRLQRRGGSSTVSNDHLELHALELSFEFLDLADLHRATAVCTEFKHAIRHSGRLISTLYARKWRDATAPPMPVAYDAVGFATVLAMYQQRRNDSAMQVSTRSQVTVQSDATVHVKNNSLLRVLSRGAIDSVRGSQALAVLPCATALGKQVTYFEVAMKGTGSVGVVSVSDAPTRSAYGYGSDEHVGWKGVSFGYHANDGDFVYNDGTAPYGGEWTPFGPAWGRMNTCADDDATTFVVGCGLDMASRRVFFTLNGTFVGFAPVVVPEGDYAAAVSLHEFNDSAVLNGGSAPFRYDIEGFCASL